MDGYLSEIRAFPYSYEPLGWLLCEGQTLAIAQYNALFSLIGVTYGGNGTTNFKLPDLRGLALVGATTAATPPGYSSYAVGRPTGASGVAAPLPPHTHTANSTFNANVPGTPVAQATATTVVAFTRGNFDFRKNTDIFNNWVTMAQAVSGAVPPLGAGGAAQPHSNIQPYLTFRFFICVDGVYPIAA